jgi:hypothetical protein
MYFPSMVFYHHAMMIEGNLRAAFYSGIAGGGIPNTWAKEPWDAVAAPL